MRDSFFLDTNIFIYTFDSRFPQKRNLSRDLVQRALEGKGCISWQVIQEFSHAALHKFARPFPLEELKEYLSTVLFPLCTVWPDDSIFFQTLTVKLETGYSWYDSLIVASALRSGAAILYSEDLQDGKIFRKLRIKNPFLKSIEA